MRKGPEIGSILRFAIILILVAPALLGATAADYPKEIATLSEAIEEGGEGVTDPLVNLETLWPAWSDFPISSPIERTAIGYQSTEVLVGHSNRNTIGDPSTGPPILA